MTRGNGVVNKGIEVFNACGLESLFIGRFVGLCKNILEPVVVFLGNRILCGKPQILLRLQCILKAALCKVFNGIIQVVLALDHARTLKGMDGKSLLRRAVRPAYTPASPHLRRGS